MCEQLDPEREFLPTSSKPSHNHPEVGWYQFREALQARNESGDFAPVSFAAFESAYKALTEKLQPMVYELGFLKA
ncbi:MAG: hypothetical protein Q8922_15590 [Bacteroidota bacterium]|nr:hypothetical protein [Bacteroidota bacterium]MDP4234799.1 hypothetical protein [Bacteroidota bacterium]MDP4289337.1 hypothetical protein [Bacteroidota bacterium]